MKQSVNLIPVTTTTWLERQYRLRWWARTWCASALFLCVITISLNQTKRDSRRRLEQAQNSIADVRSALNQLKSLRHQVKQHSDSVALGRELEQSDLPLGLIQAITSQCRTLDGHVQLKSFKLAEIASVQHARATSNARNCASNRADERPRHGMQITLNGVASSDGCTRLVAALRSMSVFQRVDLGNTQSVSDGSSSLQSFQIQCDYFEEVGGDHDSI